MAILLIPLQVFLKQSLILGENVQIKKFQHHFEGSDAFISFLDFIYVITDTSVITLYGFYLFLAHDSLLALKALLLQSFGIFFITFLKIIYKSPRPYWSDKDIDVMADRCEFDYGSPSAHIFNIGFFLNYVVYMYFVKYSDYDKVRWPLVYGLYIGLLLL